MKIFDLDTEFSSGKYKGQTLQDVFDKDPDFVGQVLLDDNKFLIGEKAMRDLRKLKPDFQFSEDALESHDRRWMRFDAMSDGGDLFDGDDLDFGDDEVGALSDDVDLF